MRYGIPILGERVAPRCTYAESVLVVELRRNRAKKEAVATLAEHSLLDLVKVLSECRIDTLVCGGISREEREYLSTRDVDIIDNVACSVDEILEALRTGSLRPGFGLAGPVQTPRTEQVTVPKPPGDSRERPSGDASARGEEPAEPARVDCLACTDRICLRGERCDIVTAAVLPPAPNRETGRMLEASLDISSEKERTLCRLSELIYFCLEMHYERIGIAYCIELQEPAEILVRVLRRFFDVYPVCCKVGGAAVSDPLISNDEKEKQGRGAEIACNPKGQAEVLNRLETDLNVLVGICMGADCIFSHFSEAPVSTLFVKDKSLANNPIGALYSDYYLDEAARASTRSR
jgi:uncharacterized metal-binding protein/predicted Fe-Mo cluster-binding NifX family protein